MSDDFPARQSTLIEWGEPLYTHRSDLNTNLLSIGAVPLDSVPRF
ncbi:MAG: hypothetical protein OJF51_000856 [Nitrospira sp.]|nr:MAG: hypothetical protein OJF51_000856 [Nitrospira sp.]